MPTGFANEGRVWSYAFQARCAPPLLPHQQRHVAMKAQAGEHCCGSLRPSHSLACLRQAVCEVGLLKSSALPQAHLFG